MISNITFDYLLIIDCWETDINCDFEGFERNHFRKMYNELIQSFSNFKFEKILFGNGDYNKFTTRLNGTSNQRFTDKSFYEYAINKKLYYMEYDNINTKYTKKFHIKKGDKFLIAGKSWGWCIHDRTYGIYNMYNKGCEVYTHPSLCYWEEHNPITITKKDIENDKNVMWEKCGSDLYKVVGIKNEILKLE
jgi:hypothetical protein